MNSTAIHAPSRMPRRRFLSTTALTTAALSLSPGLRVLGANDRVRLGFIGMGGRGINLAQGFARRDDVDIAWLCDADGRRLPRSEAALDEGSGHTPKLTQDLRHVLDDPEVDAVVIATPDHWHGLATVLACQAGKDVYVEKPLAHNVREGRRMIEAARKHKRVVQVGIQSRSAPYMLAARDYLRSGNIGSIHLVRVFNMMEHPAVPLGDRTPVPKGLDYDLWCGPAEMLPYHPQRRWLNFREFSCGPIAGDAIHQLDLARLLMNDPPAPRRFNHQGGIRVLKDGRDTPDTQIASYEYENFNLLFEAALWTPYMKKTPMGVRDTDTFPNWPFSSTKIEVLGSRGCMMVGRHGGGWQVFDANQALLAESHGRQADEIHKTNFLDCVRSRRRPNADVEHGHQSTLLCQLADAAWRAGDGAFRFDGDSESFVDAPEANRFLGRTHREPWGFPTVA